MRSCAATVSLIAALALTGGCASSAPVPQPLGRQRELLDSPGRHATLSVRLGLQLDLALPLVEEPGHVWQIVYNDTRFLRPLGDIASPASASERATASFHAMRLGRSVLRFLAVPADTVRVAQPVDHYDVVVTIN